MPQLLLPMGADQPQNADRCHQLGVAAVLDASTAKGQEIGQAAQTVLEDRSYRANATVLRDEIRTLPSSRQAAARLENLTASPDAAPPGN